MKKIMTTLVLGICLSISTKTYAKANDIDKHWAKQQIISMENQNIMFSINNKFRPNDFITRAEFMNAINNSFGYTNMAKVNFTDVYKGSWYHDDIMKAVSAGYINGYDDGSIKPNGTITREEAAKIIALACNLDKEFPQSIYGFKDSTEISEWAILHVNLLNEKGYMGGYDDGYFKPKKKLTRGETAAILANIRSKLTTITQYDIPNKFVSYGYSVQIGNFANYKAAKASKDYLHSFGFDDILIVQFDGSKLYTVLCSTLLNLDEANAIKNTLTKMNVSSFVTDKKFTETNIIKEFTTDSIVKPTIPITKPIPTTDSGNFSVQAGVFTNLDSAVNLRNKLKSVGFNDAHIVAFNTNNYYVMVKSNMSKSEATNLFTKVKALNFEGFVTSKNLSTGIKI